MTLRKLYQLILKKRNLNPKDSYTASLYELGEDRIIQKVGEEAVEVVIAAKNKNKSELTYEVADLLYHLLVLLSSKGITLEDIEDELEKRKK